MRDSMTNKNSSGDEIANVNFFTRHRPCRGAYAMHIDNYLCTYVTTSIKPSYQFVLPK